MYMMSNIIYNKVPSSTSNLVPAGGRCLVDTLIALSPGGFCEENDNTHSNDNDNNDENDHDDTDNNDNDDNNDN